VCDVIGIAAAGVAVAAGGAVASYSQQSHASQKQNTYNRVTQASNEQFRLDTMEYQNEVWQDDIKYSQDMLAWAEGEWNRQVEYAGRAQEAVEKNTLAATGQLLIRQVEEDMAVIAQGAETRLTLSLRCDPPHFLSSARDRPLCVITHRRPLICVDTGSRGTHGSGQTPRGHHARHLPHLRRLPPRQH
jgi:hypothetical protein